METTRLTNLVLNEASGHFVRPEDIQFFRREIVKRWATCVLISRCVLRHRGADVVGQVGVGFGWMTTSRRAARF